MTFLAYLKDSRTTIVSNKMRSALSMLGIVIWISSVIILMALGKWAENAMMQQMASLINNNLTIQSQWWMTVWTSEEVNGYVKAIRITPELADEIEEFFPELSGRVTYGNTAIGQVQYGSKSSMSSFAGVPIDYLDKVDFTIDRWDTFYQSDFDNAEMVAIINKNVVDALFPTGNPIWEKITYNSKEYTIIWTLEDASIIGMTYIPITTYWQKIAWNQDISALTVTLKAEDNNKLWQWRIEYFLLRKYGVSHLDLAGFTISSTASVGDTIANSMMIFTVLLAAIGGISLLVWGIGVMNIMLVSVTERTREIWIRKAIWALNKDIIQQFLIESVVITLIGGVIALIFSFLVCFGLGKLNIQYLEPVITAQVAILAITVTFVIGILSGILPAKKAANLKPIDALRFE